MAVVFFAAVLLMGLPDNNSHRELANMKGDTHRPSLLSESRNSRQACICSSSHPLRDSVIIAEIRYYVNLRSSHTDAQGRSFCLIRAIEKLLHLRYGAMVHERRNTCGSIN